MKAKTIHMTLTGKPRACGAKQGTTTTHCTEVTCKACRRTKAWGLSVISWKPEVFTEGVWSGNGLAFATKDEAHQWGRDLLMRWYVPTDSRAVPSDEPVNYRLTDTGIERIEPETEECHECGEQTATTDTQGQQHCTERHG